MRKKKTLEQFFSRARDIAKELDKVEPDESFDRTASHMAGEYVSHRSLAEEITEGFEALKQIRELEAENAELKATVRSFFQDFIDIREESDSGRVFAPITISSCRCMMIEPLAEVLAKMRKLSGSEK